MQEEHLISNIGWDQKLLSKSYLRKTLKLEKMEQPITDIEEAIKNWERRKSIEEKNQEEQRFERRIREEKQIEEMRQELRKSSRIRGEM